MKIAVIGASGWLGGSVLREAVGRGHTVTAIGRQVGTLPEGEHVAQTQADVTDPDALRAAIAGHDAVVSSVTDRTTTDRSIIPTSARALIDALPAAGVTRLVFVGGGGSLEASPGTRFIDLPDFPAEYATEARAQAEALDILRREGDELEWSYLSPPPKDLVPGEKQGGYRAAAGDAPVADAAGTSRITSGDFAAAVVDELESPRFTKQRFTAAYI
jgi:putative NADH-flavin reductase